VNRSTLTGAAGQALTATALILKGAAHISLGTIIKAAEAASLPTATQHQKTMKLIQG
jgi:hypothetical protein